MRGNGRWWLLLALAAGLLLTALACCRKEPAAQSPQHTAAPSSAQPARRLGCLLLTGYEPFGGFPFNSSWEAINELDGQEIAGRQVHAVQLPVVWGQASAGLAAAIRQHHPSIVVCFGMGTERIQIELTARNERRPYKDNRQQLPPTQSIVEDGEPVIYTRLPWRQIQKRLEEAGLECVTSYDAGGYLCNEAFYTCMVEAKAHGIRTAGFVHLPVAEPASNELKNLKKAVRIVIQACLEAEHNMPGEPAAVGAEGGTRTPMGKAH